MKNREEFDSLEVMDQIEFINKELEKVNLTEICKKIKISRSTIRERFLKQCYGYDKIQNKYICINEVEIKPQRIDKCKNNTNVSEDILKTLERRIKALEDKINKQSTNDIDINIKKFGGNTVSRCYRIYEEVQKEFSKFCKENSNYKVQDILSRALYEYMENNK